MISFQNPGLIDPRCISTIGVSVKESENPIGYFGTGLKYAIAIILKRGGSFVVHRGLERFSFAAKPVEIRGQDINVVTMNDAEMGFTTELGKNWEVWQAFREIYCNTQDEGGQCSWGYVDPTPDTTTVHVNLPDFDKAYDDLGLIFLQSKPVARGSAVEFHPQSRSMIFYRGIRVKSYGKAFRFTPNITSKITLTEDRTVANDYEVILAIARSIVGCEDADFIEKWITSPADAAEHDLDLEWPGVTPSPAFLEAVARVVPDTSRVLNRTAISLYRKHEPMPSPIEADLFDHEREALKRAIEDCRAMKFPVNEYPIVVVESLSGSILGMANRIDRTITLARRVFAAGEASLIGTLIEEWAHIKHGIDDETRQMQNWLVDSLVNMGRAYLHEKQRNHAKEAA